MRLRESVPYLIILALIVAGLWKLIESIVQ
jgi:hypothetical protein